MADPQPLTELLRSRLFGEQQAGPLANIGALVVDELIRMAVQRHEVDAMRLIFDRIDGAAGTQVTLIPGEWRETAAIESTEPTAAMLHREAAVEQAEHVRRGDYYR